MNDGLPSSFVYDVLIDDIGYAWFATANGLVRFDGKNFKNYTTDHGLKDPLIYDIHKDQKGNFWVSTEFGGMALFRNDSLIYLPELANLDSLLINIIADTPDNKLWIGTNEYGIFELGEDGSLSRILNTENGLPDNQVWGIEFDDDGNSWVATSTGVAKYEHGNEVVQVINRENGLSGTIAYQVYIASDGKKWIPTSNGVTVINPDGSLDTIIEVNGEALNYVYNIVEGNDGVIWIGTERDGLYWFDGKEYVHVTKSNGLSSNYIYRLIKDEQGTIWVSTDGNGVNIFKDRGFEIYDGTSELDVNSIYSILEASDGTLWFGTQDGISSYKNGTFRNIALPERYFDQDEIWDIEELSNGDLLMLTFDQQLIQYDGNTFFRPSFSDELYLYYLSDILVDDDGSIWFTAYQNLLKYKDGELTTFETTTDYYWQTELNFIKKDSRGFFWIGTEGGIANFDGKSFRYISESAGLMGGGIYDLAEDNEGSIWVGTNKGISVLSDFDDSGMPAKITPFETHDQYLQETIFLVFDQFGNLWQGTNGGLNYFDIDAWKGHGISMQQHFPFSDYGLGVEFNGLAAILDQSGKLWFGSNSKGLITFVFPDDETKLVPSASPKVFLRDIQIDMETVYHQLQSNDELPEIHTSFDQNNIYFNVNAVDFKNPSRILYSYKLDGFDDNWNVVEDVNEIRYTNLPPGEYAFMVKAKSINSNWGEEQVLASINVDQVFWKTSRFYIMMAIAIFVLILMLNQVALERYEKKKLKELVNEQTKDLTAAVEEKEVLIKEIHHRVKNNLAVISGLLELQSWNVKEPLAKHAIYESKMRVLAMSKIHENLYQNDDLANVNFKKFLEDLVGGISTTMRQTEQDIEVNLDVQDISINVNRGIPLGLIVNEAVSNCYKHAFDQEISGRIDLVFREEGENYFLEIYDDGKGSEEGLLKKKGTSLGISLIKSLAAQLKAQVSHSGENGTRFIFSIPKEA